MFKTNPSFKITFVLSLFIMVAGTTLIGALTLASSIVNNPPVAVNDSFTVHGRTNLPVLANDSDPDGNSIGVSGYVTTPQHGTVSGPTTWGGPVSFTPTMGYVGSDQFVYRVCDNQNACATATVTLSIVNNPPNAGDNSYTTHGGLFQAAPGFLNNDSDPDGDPLDTNGVKGCQILPHSYMCKNADGSLSYSPNYGWVGQENHTFNICDNLGACSSETLTFNSINQAPVAVLDFYVAYSGTMLAIPAPGPIANDFDPEGDTISLAGWTLTCTSTPHGWLCRNSMGSFSYTPTAGYTGLDSYTYQICDNVGGCAFGTMQFFIIGGSTSEKAPYACCPTDPAGGQPFSTSGALPGAMSGIAGASGPSFADPVNLTTGRESYLPEPDIEVYNPSGPSVSWRRAYISNQAMAVGAGYASPGFTRGWVHNYDVSIQGVSGSWGALKLVYPTGAIETLTPQLSGGVPTGAFTTAAGAPYIVEGVSGSPAGTWQSVTVTWKEKTKWKFTLLSGVTYALNQITNRTGQSLNFSWNSGRALTQVSDASSSAVLLTLAYGPSGKLSTATDIYGRQVAYTFSPGDATNPPVLQTVSQIVTSGTPNPSAHWTYGYAVDRGRQLNTITVPSPTGSGNSTATINYDTVGRVSSLVDANGNQRVYTYNATTTVVQVKDSANNVALSWTQKFNTSGLNTGITDAANHSTTIVYADSANPFKPTSVTDRNGHITSYTYDSFGNVLTITSPRNVTTTYTWSYANFALGRLTSIQEGIKPATIVTYYEPSGLIQTITKPAASNGPGTTTTTFTYDSLGNVLTVVTPGNNAASSITTTLNYTSDGAYSQSAKIGQPLTITDSLGHATHLRYDSQGRTTSVTDALGNETDFSYNLFGQLLTTTNPATGQTGSGNSYHSHTYLYVGGPLTSTTFYDESNTQVRQVTRTYGLEGESLTVAGSTEPVTNTYDALYRLKTLKDGNNNTTTYAYNNIGLLSSITMPGSEVTQFTSYDNDGNLLQRIDGNNVTTNYIYNDPESLLTDIQYPATTSLNVHFTYDSFGRRSGMTDGTGTHTYSYGNLDELLSVTTTYTGLSAKTISYSYYPNGSRQSMTTPAGSFDYSYDAAGRPTSMTNPFSETTSWAYQNNDWLQTQTLQNGAVANYSYNSMGQVTRLLNQIGTFTTSDFSSVAYDGVGNRTAVTASIPGATSLNGSTGYTYDAKNQLTQETSTRNGGFTDNFAYDSAGNPTTFNGITKTYNANNQQVGTGYIHDNNGNPTTYGGVTLTFDPENRLTSYGSVLTAGYRGDGLRAWKQNATARIYFLYDGMMPVVEMDNSGSVTATNSFGAVGLVSRWAGSGSVFYSFDSEGNVAQRSDATSNVLSNHLFDSHGAVISGTLTEPFGYKAQFGYYTDEETGLQLLTHRYYDPNTGRFLTRDPIGFDGGINLYVYVTNNPVLLIDPQGTQTKPRPKPPTPDVDKLTLEKIANATGSKLDDEWRLNPGSKSYEDAVSGLEHIGFKPFFNPNPQHWGGSDWEGEIEGNWYHVTVGYALPGHFPGVPTYRWECFPSFVTAHWEGYQPSSMDHLIDSMNPLIPMIPQLLY
ncbi:MAG TPA: Ig-like domain-containing protein [Pyrinomonadaceae bacterium]